MKSFLRLKHFLRQTTSIPHSLVAAIQKPFSHFFIKAEGSGWVLDEEARETLDLARTLGLRADRAYMLPSFVRQCVHYTSQFVVKDPAWTHTRHRLSVDYFHGLPDNDSLFAECFEVIRRIHPRLSRIRVSHSQIEQLIRSTGIAPEKVHRIPIAVNLAYFKPRTSQASSAMRQTLGIPPDAVVLGSFQKDGIGWGEGNEPKLIKGPDIFVNVARRLKEKFPHLWVLLTGPSRGFVKRGLQQAGIPFVHKLLERYAEIGRYYEAIDLYLVTSRDEGGPKAILESMASGVPLVTTRVGQARDLVRHNENAWMVEVGDEEGLAHWAQYALQNPEKTNQILNAGLRTAAENSYPSQLELWRKFFQGYVEA